jgi:hypothetical protein
MEKTITLSGIAFVERPTPSSVDTLFGYVETKKGPEPLI